MSLEKVKEKVNSLVFSTKNSRCESPLGLKQNGWDLTAYEVCSASLKSSLLTILLMEDDLTPQKAMRLSRLEEIYQIEVNGFVEGYHDMDEVTLACSVESCKLFRDLCRV